MYVAPFVAQIKNSILWDSNGEEINTDNLNIIYSNIQGGYQGEGNIDSDPLFVDPLLADFHLQENSPCINKGTSEEAPATDIEENPRSPCDGVGVGSYEIPVEDTDQDGVGDVCDTCPDDPNKVIPGICGCGIVE